MARVAPKTRKHLSADALFRLVHTGFDHIPDYRPADVDIALSDVLMSAFAMFSLKAPSLLAFDKDRAEDNLHTVTVQVVTTGITPPLAPAERLREAATEPLHHGEPLHTRR